MKVVLLKKEGTLSASRIGPKTSGEELQEFGRQVYTGRRREFARLLMTLDRWATELNASYLQK